MTIEIDEKKPNKESGQSTETATATADPQATKREAQAANALLETETGESTETRRAAIDRILAFNEQFGSGNENAETAVEEFEATIDEKAEAIAKKYLASIARSDRILDHEAGIKIIDILKEALAHITANMGRSNLNFLSARGRTQYYPRYNRDNKEYRAMPTGEGREQADKEREQRNLQAKIDFINNPLSGCDDMPGLDAISKSSIPKPLREAILLIALTEGPNSPQDSYIAYDEVKRLKAAGQAESEECERLQGVTKIMQSNDSLIEQPCDKMRALAVWKLLGEIYGDTIENADFNLLKNIWEVTKSEKILWGSEAINIPGFIELVKKFQEVTDSIEYADLADLSKLNSLMQRARKEAAEKYPNLATKPRDLEISAQEIVGLKKVLEDMGKKITAKIAENLNKRNK